MAQNGVPVRILYIVVNYRRAQLCAELARRVLDLPGSSQTHVLIVDNSETQTDRGLLAAMSADTNLSVVTPPKNLGFYGGADFGLTAYLASAPALDYVIVSNPDIDFPDEGFLTRLLGLSLPADVGALAPDIRLAPDKSLWSTGRPQNPLMAKRPSASRMMALEIIFAVPAFYWLMETRYRWRRHDAVAEAPSGDTRQIYSPHGSAIVFSRNYFDRGGNFRHGSFLYGEEMFVAEELRLKGLKCLYEPSLHLCHVGGATTTALGSNQQRLYSYQSLRFLRRRYFSGPSAVKKA